MHDEQRVDTGVEQDRFGVEVRRSNAGQERDQHFAGRTGLLQSVKLNANATVEAVDGAAEIDKSSMLFRQVGQNGQDGCIVR
ncbi:hypothetical protein [Roseibium algicola]|uniref:hypothetical protein n=1 Tax=Roseibium algicola TaxID=2857014 RepID=UPI0012EC540D|nr:hypothetical protein [Roseibium aggregatum]